ncbi:SMI1/KNR4 family protein [Verrucomicrobiota bacterium sgz303538]
MRNFDLTDFWKDSDYARKVYVGAPITDEMIRSVETELGYKLPNAYIELLRSQNGGIPVRTNHRTSQPTSWADDHVAITGIYGLDCGKLSSLCGEFSSKFWMEEWGYPNIGIYFADCPSAGHDMLCLDYRCCGPDGEPKVVHVDQESDYKITLVADTFEAFIRGLEDESAFK